MLKSPGGRLMLGFGLLHLLCCGVPLLVAAGVLTGAGGVLGSPVVLVAGVALLALAVVLGVRRAALPRPDDCCVPPAPAAGSERERSTTRG